MWSPHYIIMLFVQVLHMSRHHMTENVNPLALAWSRQLLHSSAISCLQFSDASEAKGD